MHAGGRSSATEASEVQLPSPGSCESHCRSHGRSLTSAEVLLTLTFKKHAVMWSIAMFGFAVRQGWPMPRRSLLLSPPFQETSALVKLVRWSGLMCSSAQPLNALSQSARICAHCGHVG